MNRVSFIIPVFNNFLYTKHIYENLKQYFPDDEIVISDGGSTDETIEYFTNIDDANLIIVNNGKINLCENYNRGVENATSDITILLHNDMFIPPNFKQRILADLQEDTIISYARIEPPVFPGEEPGKVVRDFGFNLDTLNVDDIIKFSESYDLTYEGGGYLFIACYKNNWIKMDEVTFNPPQMWAADDDLHIRFRLSNYKLLISNAIVYHFVSKTSRSTTDYREVELKSNRNYVRKWGSRSLPVKYNIAYVVKNCVPNLLPTLEPHCDRLYVDDHYGTMITNYIESEQPNTKFDLLTRVLNTSLNDPYNENDIVVEFDATQLTNQNFTILQQLPDILYNQGELGEFTIEIFKLSITSLTEYQNNLIKLS